MDKAKQFCVIMSSNSFDRKISVAISGKDAVKLRHSFDLVSFFSILAESGDLNKVRLI